MTSVVYARYWQDLAITITLVDGQGRPISGSSVGLVVDRDGVRYATAGGVTSSTGKLTTALRRASNGCYSTRVTSVSAPGWDGATPSNGFCG